MLLLWWIDFGCWVVSFSGLFGWGINSYGRFRGNWLGSGERLVGLVLGCCWCLVGNWYGLVMLVLVFGGLLVKSLLVMILFVFGYCLVICWFGRVCVGVYLGCLGWFVFSLWLFLVFYWVCFVRYFGWWLCSIWCCLLWLLCFRVYWWRNCGCVWVVDGWLFVMVVVLLWWCYGLGWCWCWLVSSVVIDCGWNMEILLL